MATTYAEILATAKTALAGILANKTAEYNVNGIGYTYHNLADLTATIKELERLAARESGARPVVLLADTSRRPS